MKYITCQEPGKFIQGVKAAPKYDSHEVLLRIKKIGICGTDLHAFQGNQAFFSYPRILGHELAAIVEATGNEVSNVKPGDKVAIMPYIHCGRCIACRNGKTNCCTDISVMGVHTDGGMQEKLVVSAQYLIPVNDLSYEAIAIIEPLAIGAHALSRAQLSQGDTIVVMGCGPIGLGIMKQARDRGASVIAIDFIKSRLEFAKKFIGADHIINAGDRPVEQVREITTGDMATAVFDATGNKLAIENGIEYMASGGKFIIVGLTKRTISFHHPVIHAKECSILCSRNATPADFQDVISTLRKGNFPVDQYISHRVTFSEMTDHFENWTDPKAGVIKALVEL